MIYTLIGGILFLLVATAIDAQIYPDDIQVHYVRGRAVLSTNHSLFTIQNSLERAEVALTSALAVNGSHEETVIRKLIASQVNEIKRVSLFLMGLEAVSCTTGCVQKAKDAVSNSVTIYEDCVNENLTELQETIENLTSVEDRYRTIYIEHGPSVIDECASDALGKSNQGKTAEDCVDMFLQCFYRDTFSADAILLSVEDRIKQALRIIPTCTNRSRNNAIRSVNAIIESIGSCVESYQVKVNIKKFTNYVPSLSGSVSFLSVFDLSECNETNVGLLKTLSILEYALRKTYEQGKQATLSHIKDVAGQKFIREISLINNASLITDLTPEQIRCVNKAGRDMVTTIHKAAVEWMKCSNKYTIEVYPKLMSVEELITTVNERLSADGIAAFMRCITNNMANPADSYVCINTAFDKFDGYVANIYRKLHVEYRNYSLPYGKCRSIFLSNTKAGLDSIIATLKTCVPQVNVTKINSRNFTGDLIL